MFKNMFVSLVRGILFLGTKVINEETSIVKRGNSYYAVATLKFLCMTVDTKEYKVKDVAITE